jgi:IS5 family transposase
MRKKSKRQIPLIPCWANHQYAQELQAISRILDANPAILEMVLHDVSDKKKTDTGAPGMTAEQVVRCALIKQLEQFSYEKLAFHLADSVSFQTFCRLPWGQTPSVSTLHSNISRIRETTWQEINRVLVGWAQRAGLEAGRQIRIDSTAVETHIHYPLDSALLKDCVHALTRRMEVVNQLVEVTFQDHRRRARRRALAILNARGMERKVPLYRDLVKVTRLTYADASRVMDQIVGNPDPRILAEAVELKRLLELTEKVISQTVRRVFQGETVPAEEKVVSIFEEHTDIIRKGQRETTFGHKVFLTVGKSSLVLDCVTLRGNVADSTQVEKLLDRQKDLYGRYPRQASLDAGFASKPNLKMAKQDKGIKDMAFAAKAGIKIADMVKSSWVYEKLRRFRAGIEGCISYLKRIFGWDRCDWRGWEHFQRYVHLSVVSYNLLVLARLTL